MSAPTDRLIPNPLPLLFPWAGIAILVNTCCPLTQAHYAKFCGHVTAAAMLDKDLVPVTNRYAIVESSLNCFMHGYVLDIPTSSFFFCWCLSLSFFLSPLFTILFHSSDAFLSLASSFFPLSPLCSTLATNPIVMQGLLSRRSVFFVHSTH